MSVIKKVLMMMMMIDSDGAGGYSCRTLTLEEDFVALQWSNFKYFKSCESLDL